MIYFNPSTIQDLRNKFESFTKDIEVILRDIELIEREKVELIEEKKKLEEIRNDIQKREAHVLFTKNNNEIVASELRTLKKDLDQQNIVLEEKRKESLITIKLAEEKKQALEELMGTFKERQLEFSKNEERFNMLDEKENQLREREINLEREKALDRERKIMLDAKEQNLKRDRETIARIMPS